MSAWNEESSVGWSCVSFLIGGVLGASLALLYAPQPGELTRREMRQKAERTIIRANRLEEELKHTISQLIENLNLKISQVIEEGKHLADEKKQEILSALEFGKAALEEERYKLERS